ncbi:hypothetical protein IVB45_02140 [Bradyrhizobium sp. 4]|uniref:hypothetical protein n=1 Tax=Bradyrhizobium sp. 4 TaxID=2782678 RepID=UPI001FFFB421|nr:hypothetical protein [Bradyrhizobium sp. 4]UPJ35834.1 hypothetical protein IVB45_02140 [Bradyrhizobium sp. 4]
MKLEQQVCSLDLAKKLKELGVKWESAFSWIEHEDGEWRLLRFGIEGTICVAAFTVAELGEMMPGNFGGHYVLTQKGLMGNRYYSTLMRLQDSTEAYKIEEKTEADARAKMLIYAIENKLIELNTSLAATIVEVAEELQEQQK